MTTLDLSDLFRETATARLGAWRLYAEVVQQVVPAGDDVTLTGSAPVWLYLLVAHALHGRARKLYYRSPVVGLVPIFDHDAGGSGSGQGSAR